MAIYVETMGKRECVSPDRTVHDLLKVAVASKQAEEVAVTVQEVPTMKMKVETPVEKPTASTSTCIKDTLDQLKTPKEVK